MMMTHSQDRVSRPRRKALGGAFVVVLALLGAMVAPASARWVRGFSDINRDANDLAVCADTITLEAFLNHQTSSFESSFPDFVGVPDVTPYPGVFVVDSIRVYGSAADAIANVAGTEVVTVDVPLIYRTDGASSYRFSGQATVPTPAGFDNGDTLYAYSFDLNGPGGFEELAIPLPIGDPAYDCPAEQLNWGILKHGNQPVIGAYLPHSFLFDVSEVDPATLMVAVDGAASVSVAYVGRIGNVGLARVNLNDAGLRCETNRLTLSGTDSGGYDYAGSLSVIPQGVGCEAG